LTNPATARMPADLGFDSFATASGSKWATVRAGGAGPDKEQRMAGKQSAAVVELYWRWLTVPAADHERTPRDNGLSMDGSDAIAHLADWSRPKLPP
jgi:hypothetical protein